MGVRSVNIVDKVLQVLGALIGLTVIFGGVFFLIESFESLLPEAMIFWSLACLLTGSFSLYWALGGSVFLRRLIGGKSS
jgi:hypothetical protein